MFKDMPQCVPQEVCLSCEGCCRFDNKASDWRPKAGADELYAWKRNASINMLRMDVDKQGYLPTKKYSAVNRACACVFFDAQELKCTLYAYRPFECRLYPFVLRKKDNKAVIGFHWACPHMQDSFGRDDFKKNIQALKTFFNENDEVRRFIAQNQHLITDYEKYNQEIEDVFELDLGPVSKEDHLLSQRIQMQAQYRASPLPLAAQDTSAVFSWKEYFDIEVRNIDGVTCLFLKDGNGCFMPMAPLIDKIPMGIIEQCFDKMNAVNVNKEISRIENVNHHQVQEFDAKHFRTELKSYEYCYYKNDIAELAGSGYKSKRSDYNNFISNNDFIYRAYSDKDFDSCVALYSRWAENRKRTSGDEIYLQMIEENREVHPSILANWMKLGLTGSVVMVNGEIAAYTFGYPMGERIFCVMLEIADVNFKGLPTFIFREFCRDRRLSGFDFINVMDDCCLPSIGKTKMTFKPVILNPSYTVRLR